MRQEEAFLGGEAKAWLRRNKTKIDVDNDPILKTMEEAIIRPKMVFEIGCADGWRLEAIRKIYGADCFGCDPGLPAKDKNSKIWCGTARHTGVTPGVKFDVLIYGFCLYLCDRETLPGTVMAGDRLLREDGYLIIWDFDPDEPHARPYHHVPGLFSYKMDHAKLWLGNPAYQTHFKRNFDTESGDTRTSVTILKKSLARAWPVKT